MVLPTTRAAADAMAQLADVVWEYETAEIKRPGLLGRGVCAFSASERAKDRVVYPSIRARHSVPTYFAVAPG